MRKYSVGTVLIAALVIIAGIAGLTIVIVTGKDTSQLVGFLTLAFPVIATLLKTDLIHQKSDQKDDEQDTTDKE